MENNNNNNYFDSCTNKNNDNDDILAVFLFSSIYIISLTQATRQDSFPQANSKYSRIHRAKAF